MGLTQVIRYAALLFASTVFGAIPNSAWADSQSQSPPPVRTVAPGTRLGVQGFGAFGISIPAASESFEALGMATQVREFGAGGRVINLWRQLFIEATVSRWKGSGSRAFVDSRGARFDLGIPLDVQATYVDAGAGWRFERRTRAGLPARVVPFVGVGVGLLDYKERSTFAESGEDVADSLTAYSAFGGVEVLLTSWLGVAGDVRYRFANGILGADGVSLVEGDDRLSGPAVSVRIMAGRFGPRRAGPPPPSRRPAEESPAVVTPPGAAGHEPEPAAAPAPTAPGTSVQEPERAAAPRPTAPGAMRGRPLVMAVEPTPVRILPDVSRPPLRVLEPRTRMTLVGEEGEWFRVEFRDPQWGVRVGYVEKSRVRLLDE